MSTDNDEDLPSVDVHIEYRMGDDGEPTLGEVNLRTRKVSPEILCDTYLVLARQLLAASMVENMFNSGVPIEVREHAANLMASEYIIQRLKSGDIIGASAHVMRVPNDASELFED